MSTTKWKIREALDFLFLKFKNLDIYLRDEARTFAELFLPQPMKRYDFSSLEGERLIVCAHFDIDERFDPAFLYFIEKIKYQLNAKVMVVSTNLKLSDGEIETISTKIECLIIRKNFGRDFGSWKLGLSLIEDNQKYRSVILANDTIYGPFQSIKSFIDRIESQTHAAVGGMTDFYGASYHLQSYFLIFNQACLKTPWFNIFWKKYRNHHGRRQTITNGEKALSRSAQKNKIELIPMFPYYEIKQFVLTSQEPLEVWREKMKSCEVNPYHFFWKELIENFNYPFIKVELLRTNPSKIANINEYKFVLQGKCDYPVSLIENHVKRVRNRTCYLPQVP